jgi:hypothetical protein
MKPAREALLRKRICMKKIFSPCTLALFVVCRLHAAESSAPFTGRLEAVLVRGGQTQTFITTAGTNCLRLERAETDRPYARNLIQRDTGERTLLFPNNRSFMRLPLNRGTGVSPVQPPALPPHNFPAPAGLGPQGGVPSAPASIGPTNLPRIPAPPAMPAMPAMGGGMPARPMMPMMPMMAAPTELTATDARTNLLGYACRRYELKSRGEVMEIWAAETNLPFAAYWPNQPPRFGPRRLEEQWAGLVAAKNLFPVLAVLKIGNGPERLRYELKTVTPQKPADQPAELFLPPADYQPLDPLPF